MAREVFSVLIRYTHWSHVVEPVKGEDGISRGNPSGTNVETWAIEASSKANALAHARKLIPKDAKIQREFAHGTGIDNEPAPDKTIEINGQKFTYKQPGSPLVIKAP